MNIRSFSLRSTSLLCAIAIGSAGLSQFGHTVLAQEATAKPETISDATETEARFLSNTRQLTFDGIRAGEGYFSRDGKSMVFQSERDKTNPFYQIYWMDRETGDVERVSPGFGKTTCAWIHPEGDRVLFASTQFDPEFANKQKAELDERATGKPKAYAWDYDDQYDLVEWNRKTHKYKKLTDIKGYDAEASYSPDGSTLLFPPTVLLTNLD